MIDRVASGERVAQVCEIRHGEIGAVYAIELMGDVPSLVLKLYPETLHWKMQKEVNVCALLSAGSASACRAFSWPKILNP